jgi:hypothetical protein
MIIFGDMGTTNAQILTPVQNEVSNGTASYVLHIGDFACTTAIVIQLIAMDIIVVRCF